MNRALDIVQDGDAGLNAASNEYSDHKSTLKRRLDGQIYEYFTTQDRSVLVIAR
jgi:hypothetical protein